MELMEKKDTVRTAARTVDVFEAFAQEKAPLSLTDLANRLNVPVSSCHALLRTLQARGYVYSMDHRKRIYPTKRLLTIATAIAENDPFLERLKPILTRLRDVTGETVLLGKRQGDAVQYLEVIEGTHTIRYSAGFGEAKPLHSSAIGKCILGELDDRTLDELLSRLKLTRVTRNTITDSVRLKEDLRASRRRGYFTTKGENVVDVMALSVARRIDDELFGVALAGPIPRMKENEKDYAARLIEAAERFREIDAELRAL